MMKSVFEEKKNVTTMVGSIVIFMMMILIFWGMADAETFSQADIEKKILEIDEGKNGGDRLISHYLNNTEDGYAVENQAAEIDYSIENINVVNVTFKLRWSDEADADARHGNAPDSFTLSVESPDNSISEEQSGENGQGQEGSLELTINLFDKNDDPDLPVEAGTGTWKIYISVDAGDQVFWRPSMLDQDLPDNGNDFTLEISTEYLEMEG